jgi:AsmA protein
MKKSVKIGVAAAIALPILAAAAIRLFVDANPFRPMIASRLTAALSRKVTLGTLSLSVTTGSLVANDLAIAEDPKFGRTPFFTAKRLRIGVQMKPLIFNRQLIVRSFEVDAPQIHLILAENGSWNFSTLSHGAGSQNTTRAAILRDLPVDLITIKDGNAKIETLPLQRNPQVYDQLDVKLEHFSLAKGFPFTVSASLPGDGTVGVSGTVGPINSQDAASTTFDAQLTIKHLDPVAAEYVDPAAGISMLADLDAHIVSDQPRLQDRWHRRDGWHQNRRYHRHRDLARRHAHNQIRQRDHEISTRYFLPSECLPAAALCLLPARSTST